MGYRLLMAKRAKGELAELPEKFKRQVDQEILKLPENPRPQGVKKLHLPESGLGICWRIRSGKFRIIYKIDDAAQTVTVTGIGDRKDVYRRFR